MFFIFSIGCYMFVTSYLSGNNNDLIIIIIIGYFLSLGNRYIHRILQKCLTRHSMGQWYAQRTLHGFFD